ncbi:hypothetical protein AB0I16_23890 [Streptomyces sp. NPDC050703]|uniref:hypothetical protein n=1 Tax=Streptomyces sp. NPDC050703 TaxID=3157218 RepID=UPI00342BE2EF
MTDSGVRVQHRGRHRRPGPHTGAPAPRAVEVAADHWRAVRDRLAEGDASRPAFDRAIPAPVALHGDVRRAVLEISCFEQEGRLLGLVTGVGTIVTALGMMMAPLGGVWADIVDRRALLIVIDLARFVVVALIAVGVMTDSPNLVYVYVYVYIAAAVLGTGESVYLVTARAFLPKGVPAERLITSNG